ncbi:hypothetical protein Thal_0823 [Thermocrinis albus DSM 14484]|uniref:Quinohemoprotein amine dehydrogenase alpha subunit haem binding domain-containing protein n=1 Tax=Thermocrinis albus (strain DSM 14484 / JCM 11386 / HI 11/12) TaxID=638303 RepID=D3SL26_THEAH|nr:hypothetical protein [Thermocrinis albus]ADC89456.1 hypothetical protein Thal_0823 [Thermocrinis albus DSM 14484]
MKRSLIILCALVAGYASAKTLKGSPEERKLVEQNCVLCHSLDYIEMVAPLTPQGWEATVKKMVNVFKAPVSPEDQKKILEYLNKYYTGR